MNGIQRARKLTVCFTVARMQVEAHRLTDESKALIYSTEGSVVRLTLNRPEKRNALNDDLIAALKDSIRAAAGEESIRVILIDGAGSDFCAGADLSALQKMSQASVAENEADARSLMELFWLMRQVPVPIVAAVHGKALAGGCGLASACDIVLASTNARFGYPEVKLGFVPAIVTAILRRNVSEKRAFELLTRGAEIGAEEARQINLVNHVFSEASFAAEVIAYVSQYEKTSRSAVALTKTLLYQVDGMTFHDALSTGVDVNVIARLTEDCQKGIARFVRKE
jgi:methylglutaconyl-CoA hydratase